MAAPRPPADGGSYLGFLTNNLAFATGYTSRTITMSGLTPGHPYQFRWNGYGWRHRAGVSHVAGGLYNPADIADENTDVIATAGSKTDETFDAAPFYVDITYNAAAVQTGDPGGTPGMSIWTDPEIGAGDDGAGFVFWPTGTSVTFTVWVHKRIVNTDGNSGADYYGGGTTWPEYVLAHTPTVGVLGFGAF